MPIFVQRDVLGDAVQGSPPLIEVDQGVGKKRGTGILLPGAAPKPIHKIEIGAERRRNSIRAILRITSERRDAGPGR